MLLCEFCTRFRRDRSCELGLNLPKRMTCREFDPSVERFCANPADFVSEAQLAQMAAFFDIRGTELKKIRAVAAREVGRRVRTPSSELDIRER
jgi:hypothetical protein